jgi:hypothetical protein
MITMNAKHSPGPWRRTNLTVHTVAPEGALVLARVLESGVETLAASTPEQATANANLIAAAPELLAALEDASRALDVLEEEHAPLAPSGNGCCVICDARIKARVAIARAKGQTP